VATERRLFAWLVLGFLPACGSGSAETAPNTGPKKDKSALTALRYDAGPPPADASNRVADDPKARALGQRLFFDPSFSGQLLEGDNDGSGGTLGMRGDAGKVSCASCHVPATEFVDTRSPHRQISLAAEWTTRKTPTLLEVAFAPLYNWDGRRDSIWGQAIGVMESSKEFNSGRLFVATQMVARYRADYEAAFGPVPAALASGGVPALTPAQAGCIEIQTMQGSRYACRGKPGDGADYDALASADQTAVTTVTVNAAKALEAYVRTLRCGASRFDAWLDGDESALSASEQRGAALFVGAGKCASCHSGPNLTDGKFHNVGLAPATVAVAFIDTGDRGAAGGVTAALTDPLSTHGAFSDGDRHALPSVAGPELVGAFRTPTLRCVSSHPSFMHTGQMRTLEQVVDFHDRGGDSPGNYPGQTELAELHLSDGERADLVAFLKTLDGPGPPEELLHAPVRGGS
jgi:cytochrome c peroxidase